MANTKITTNVIADDAVTSDKLGGDLTMPGHVSLADNKELRIGTGNDLVIKHDGSHTTLTNTTGNFTLLGDAVYIGNAANNEYLAQFIANGAASLRYDDTEQLATVSGGVYVPNKLGIGVNAPDSFLHVKGSKTFAATEEHLKLENTATGEPVVLSMMALADNGGTGNEGAIYFDAGANGTVANNLLQFSANHQNSTTPQVTITGDGNVGIGLTNPSSNLHIRDESSNTNTYNNVLRIESQSTGTTVAGFGGAIYFLGERNGDGALQGMGRIISLAEVNSGTTLSSGMAFHTATAGTPSEKLRITHDGNVGIGVIPSGARLHVVSAGSGVKARFSDNTSETLDIGITTDSHAYLNQANSGPIAFQIGGTEIARVTTAGIVMTDGKGIDFSATGSGTSTSGQAHVLDEYEYGSWTPTCHTGSATFVSPYYVKIGRVVHFSFQVHQFTDTSTASSIDIRGLPFPCLVGQAAGTVFGIYLDTEVDSVYVNTAEEIFFYELTNSGWYAARHSDINSSSAYFYVGGTYITTS